MLRDRGLSFRTIRNVRAILRCALEQAKVWGYVARNAAEATEPPRGVAPKIKPLTKDQARRLIEAVKGHRLEALYRIALSLGLRRGEVLGLLWSDIDLDKGTLRITGQVQTLRLDGCQNVRTSSAKTAAGARELPLPDLLVQVLRRHWELQQLERSTLGVDWKEHGLVFPSKVGTPIWPRNLIRNFKLILQAAGLPETTRFHDLRHSCATILLAQGVSLKTVSDILGHTDIRTTANIYGHTDDDQKRDATERIAGLFEDLEETGT
jgi:integrase